MCRRTRAPHSVASAAAQTPRRHRSAGTSEKPARWHSLVRGRAGPGAERNAVHVRAPRVRWLGSSVPIPASRGSRVRATTRRKSGLRVSYAVQGSSCGVRARSPVWVCDADAKGSAFAPADSAHRFVVPRVALALFRAALKTMSSTDHSRQATPSFVRAHTAC